MNEKLICKTVVLVDPTEGNAPPTMYFYTPVAMTIVMVCAAPHVDDAGADIDIADDGTDVITAVDAADADVPGTWKATGYGGTNSPVVIAAGSKVSVVPNDAAAATQITVDIWFLTGEIFS